jgi:hypothetical protein
MTSPNESGRTRTKPDMSANVRTGNRGRRADGQDISLRNVRLSGPAIPRTVTYRAVGKGVALLTLPALPALPDRFFPQVCAGGTLSPQTLAPTEKMKFGNPLLRLPALPKLPWRNHCG